MTIFSSVVISLLLFKGKSKLRPFWLGRVFPGPPLYTRYLYSLGKRGTLGIFFPGYLCLPLSTFYGMRGIIKCFIRLVGTVGGCFKYL